MLTKTRWLLLKRPENLTDKQESKRADLLQYNLRSIRSYLLKEEFQLFWLYTSLCWAGLFLDRWCIKTMRSKIEPMKKVAKMLRRHHPLLLNWFRAKKQFSSGIVEGFNTKAKLTTRKAYGFRTYHAAEIALYHALGALPIPKSTHEFFWGGIKIKGMFCVSGLFRILLAISNPFMSGISTSEIIRVWTLLFDQLKTFLGT